MKKIMFAIAMMAAVAVNAASINWSVSNNAFSLESGGSKNGVTVYLIDAASQASIVDAINKGTFSGSTAGVLDVATTSNTKGAVAAHVATSEALTSGTSYNFAALILDSKDGDNYYNITAALSGKAFTVGVDEEEKIAFAATQFSGGTGWTKVAGSTPVDPTPEPTSGLLLLVGAGMLALRRRCA